MASYGSYLSILTISLRSISLSHLLGKFYLTEPLVADLLLPDLNDRDDHSGRPKYERLKDHLLGEMRDGRLTPGDALPSEQRLAETLNVARSTVRQAMAALERDGVIARIHGKGTFIHEKAYQQLRGGQDLFAFIVPETQSGFYPWLLRSFEESAKRVHHQVIVCNSNNEVDKQGNAILQLIDHEVGGVAMVPTTAPATPAYHVRQLQKNEIPVVFCSRRIEGIPAPLVAIPFEEVGRRAGQAILSAGHTQIAYFGVHRASSSLAYETGFRKAIDENGDPDIQLEVFYGKNFSPQISAHEAEVDTALARMCNRENRPTAIFASFDSFAELIFMLLTQRGFRIPEDISVVGFGGARREGALLNRMTSVTVDEVLMGQQAIELLDKMRSGSLPLQSDAVYNMPLDLNQGKTLGPPTGLSRVIKPRLASAPPVVENMKHNDAQI